MKLSVKACTERSRRVPQWPENDKLLSEAKERRVQLFKICLPASAVKEGKRSAVARSVVA